MTVRILALTKYGPMAASTRQRFVQYEPALKAAGFEVEYSALLGDDHMLRLVQGRRAPVLKTAVAYASRIKELFRARRFEAVWMQYEFFPYLPGFTERIAAQLVNVPIIVDYDDAVFHRYDENAPWPVRLVADRKLEPLLRQAAACCCGNMYVKRYVEQFCEHSIVLPTVVDTNVYRPAPGSRKEPVIIGWIGSPSTWPNMRPLLPTLRELGRTAGVQIRAVGTGVAAEADRFPGLELVEWSEATEVAEVQKMDIGIMPLVDRPFERGKSGFKLIQYMACGLPVVASPVGVNKDIVADGQNGLLAGSELEWRDALARLIGDAHLRRRMGEAGRKQAVTEYSLASQALRLVELLQEVVASGH